MKHFPVSHSSAGAPRVKAVRLLFVAMLTLASGCGAPAPLGEQQLYDEASQEFERGNFSLASQRYDELLEQFPFSDLSEVARLRVGQAYYLNGDYHKAIAAFRDFERLHPTSRLLDFVEYTIGMSHLDQARSRDRDKSATDEALRQFDRVGERYPASIYGRLAEYREEQCEQKLASHELYVGDYYVKTGEVTAGLARYRYVLDYYPATDAALLCAERLGLPSDEYGPNAPERTSGYEIIEIPASETGILDPNLGLE